MNCAHSKHSEIPAIFLVKFPAFAEPGHAKAIPLCETCADNLKKYTRAEDFELTPLEEK